MGIFRQRPTGDACPYCDNTGEERHIYHFVDEVLRIDNDYQAVFTSCYCSKCGNEWREADKVRIEFDDDEGD